MNRKLLPFLVVFIGMICLATILLGKFGKINCAIDEYPFEYISSLEISTSNNDSHIGPSVYRLSENQLVVIDNSSTGNYINREIKAYIRGSTLYISYKKDWAMSDSSLSPEKGVYVVNIPADQTISKISLDVQSLL